MVRVATAVFLHAVSPSLETVIIDTYQFHRLGVNYFRTPKEIWAIELFPHRFFYVGLAELFEKTDAHSNNAAGKIAQLGISV